jgi:hypothetical protein
MKHEDEKTLLKMYIVDYYKSASGSSKSIYDMTSWGSLAFIVLILSFFQPLSFFSMCNLFSFALCLLSTFLSHVIAIHITYREAKKATLSFLTPGLTYTPTGSYMLGIANNASIIIFLYSVGLFSILAVI